jgi:hypothetical protein
VLRGSISAANFAGDTVEYHVDLGGHTIRAKGHPFVLYAEGTPVFARVPAERCHVLGSPSSVASLPEPLPA